MNFKSAFILFITSPISNFGVQIKSAEKISIIKAINNARFNVTPPAFNLQKVDWDIELEKTLKAYKATPSWYFMPSTKYNNTIDFNVNFNLMFLMREPTFKPYYDKGYNYIFHDTCNNRVNDVLNIFKFRIRQQHCFDYDKCEPHGFTNFMSCSKYPIIRGSGTPCSWWWRYYIPIVREDLQSIACVRLHIPGPFTPSMQKDSFACYGKLPQAKNDIPYKLKI